MENYSLPSSSRSVLHTRRCSVLRGPARWHLGHSFWVCLHHSFVLHQHRYDFSGLWCLHVYLFAHRFPPASASYILLQFAQYGNILKHVVSTGKFQDCFIDDLYSIKICFFYLQMSNTGNWMHVQYQSKMQARKALSKDGKIFGEAIMIGVKPCIDKVSD